MPLAPQSCQTVPVECDRWYKDRLGTVWGETRMETTGEALQSGLMFVPGANGPNLWRLVPGGQPNAARFDPKARVWIPGEPSGKTARPVTPETAVRWLQDGSGARLRPPIGVIGAREASEADLGVAEAVGRDLARLGLVLLTGGKSGIMEAACRGTEAEGGLAIGVLPDEDWGGANRHVTVPLASGLGVARNAVVARASFALIAIAGGYGTLSEIAFGLQFGRPVLALPSAPQVPGATACPDWPAARAALCLKVLCL